MYFNVLPIEIQEYFIVHKFISITLAIVPVLCTIPVVIALTGLQSGSGVTCVVTLGSAVGIVNVQGSISLCS